MNHITFNQLNLSKQLLNALEDLGLTEPTTIQAKVFPMVMSGKSVVGISQTGTGKTLAYLLPLLRLHRFSKIDDPTILIVVPTRELVEQVVNEVKKLTTYMTLRVGGVYGGTNINTQKNIVLEGLDVLVATPGRLVDLVLNGALKLKSVQKLVIDEVDEMFDLGFRTQLNNIFDLLPEKRQNLMFSATFTEEVETLVTTQFFDAERVEAAPPGTPLDKIIQLGYEVPNFYTKVNLLIHLLKNNQSMTKVLVFTGSKRLADLVYEKTEAKFKDQVGIIHANKAQNTRFNSLRRFQQDEHRVLIATDLVARGLDLSDVTHVVNIDTPEEPTTYIHRIGRTGRADKEGTAITFTTEKENSNKVAIEDFMSREITSLPLPEDLVIATELIDDEKPSSRFSQPEPVFKRFPAAGAAFHEKKEKNKKVNLGGSYWRELKEKYKKPITKPGGKKNKKK